MKNAICIPAPLLALLGTIIVGCGQSVTPQAQTPTPPTASQPAPSPTQTPTPIATPAPTQTAEAQAPQTAQPLSPPASSSGDRGKIEFAAGSSSATVEGTLANKATAQYTFDAAADQTATIAISSPNQVALLTLVAPSGSPIQRYQSGLATWSGTLPETGTYRISVVATQATSYKLNLAIAQKKP